MPITREQFENARETLGAHTSWAVWAPAGEKPKSNVGDLSIFNEEEKIQEILPILNPDIVLAGLSGSNGPEVKNREIPPFSNFHSNWSRATEYKIRFATVDTVLEGAFMTDVIKFHYETDSNIVVRDLRKDEEYEAKKVEEFFQEIKIMSNRPVIFAFGGMAGDLIQKYNYERLDVYKLFHYAFTMSKEKFREHTSETIRLSGLC